MLAERSWGVQLWDQTSNLIKYQESGIALHEKLQKFIIEIAKLQVDSFVAQKRVCEKALINIKKVVGLETTFGQGYNAFIHAIAKLIDSENILPVSFNLQANGEMKQSIEEERKSMKQWRHDRDRFQNETKNQARIIDEEIKRYQEKYRDVIRSKEDYDRADEDKTYSKLDVERALIAYTQKRNDFKRARSDYSAALDQFNLHRRYHYNTTLKNWGEAGQTLESYRITKTKEMISVLVERLRVMIERLVTVATDLESAADMMDAEKDTTALIERLKTGNDPPGDVPIIYLDVGDPPVSSNQISGRSAGDSGPTDAISHRRTSSTGLENVDSGIYYASIPVSPTAGRGSSPFVGADPVVEPYEAHRLHTATHSNLSRSSRRSSVSAVGLVSNGNTGGHSSFLWKVFTRRSKRIGSGDDSAISFESTKPWRSKRRSKSVGSYFPLEMDLPLRKSSIMEKKFSVKYKAHMSREAEKLVDVGVHNARTSKPQLQREPSKKIEIVRVENEETKESVAANSSDISDFDAKSNPPIPSLIPSSTSLLKPSRSTQELSQMTVELSRSLPSPSSSSNDLYGSKTKSNRPLPASHTKSQSSEPYQIGASQNSPTSSPQFRKNSVAGIVTDSHMIQQNTQEITSSKQKICHQPKRPHVNRHQLRTTHAENKVSHKSSVSYLIVVGKCKALYDFESSQYGDTFISFKQGDELRVISSSARWHGNADTDGWIYAETIPPSNDLKALPQRGFIPAAFVEIDLFPEPIPLSSPRKREIDEGISYKGSHGNLRRNNSFLALGQATEL